MLYALIPLGSSARGRPSQEFQRCLHCQQDYQACEYRHVRYCYRPLSLRRAPWTSGERTSTAGALPSRSPSITLLRSLTGLPPSVSVLLSSLSVADV